MYNSVELYEKDNKVAVLVSKKFGTEWSVGVDSRLAYDRRVVNFWLAHHENEEFVDLLCSYTHNAVNDSVKKLFESWGYNSVCFLGFNTIQLHWVPKGTKFQIREYDGNEYLVYYKESDWTCF